VHTHPTRHGHVRLARAHATYTRREHGSILVAAPWRFDPRACVNRHRPRRVAHRHRRAQPRVGPSSRAASRRPVVARSLASARRRPCPEDRARYRTCLTRPRAYRGRRRNVSPRPLAPNRLHPRSFRGRKMQLALDASAPAMGPRVRCSIGLFASAFRRASCD
jgi:hypothetical protein